MNYVRKEPDGVFRMPKSQIDPGLLDRLERYFRPPTPLSPHSSQDSPGSSDWYAETPMTDYDRSVELEDSESEEDLFDLYDLSGFTKEEVRNYNRMAPPSQRLERSTLENSDQDGMLSLVNASLETVKADGVDRTSSGA